VYWCVSEARKYKKRNHNDGHDDLLLNCKVGWKKHTANLALIEHRDFHKRIRKEVLRANGGFHSE